MFLHSPPSHTLQSGWQDEARAQGREHYRNRDPSRGLIRIRKKTHHQGNSGEPEANRNQQQTQHTDLTQLLTTLIIQLYTISLTEGATSMTETFSLVLNFSTLQLSTKKYEAQEKDQKIGNLDPNIKSKTINKQNATYRSEA